MKLKKVNQTMSLNEISQNTQLKFSLCSVDKEKDTVTSLHKFVKCRDYLNEAVLGQYIGFSFDKIYGFKLDPDKHKIDLDRASFVLQMNSEVFNKFKTNFPRLNQFEIENGFEASVFEILDYPNSTGLEVYLYLQGDVRWFSSTLYTSLYSYLIRLLGMVVFPEELKTMDDILEFIPKKGSGNDAMYATHIVTKKVKIAPFLKNYTEITKGCDRVGLAIKEPESKYEVGYIHDHGGIQTFCAHYDYYALNKKFADHQKLLKQQVINYYQVVNAQ